MIAEVPYGLECPNDSRIKKTSYRICETCGFRKYLGKAFATCSWTPQTDKRDGLTQEEKLMIAKLLRRETGCGLMEASIAIDKLITVFKVRPPMVMDNPPTLKITWDDNH